MQRIRTRPRPSAREAPDFTLQSVRRNRITLSDYRHRQHVILVFNRGFTCPFCRQHLAQLRYDYNQLARLDAAILVIGPEDRDTFTAHWRRENYPFVGLPDPEHRVADRYEQEVNLNKLGRLPASILVDKQGRIQFRHYGDSIRDVAPNDELVTRLRRLNDNTNGKR